MKTITGLIEHIRKHSRPVLRYLSLDKESIKVWVYSDGSFVTTKDGTSQVWYLIFKADKENLANLIDHARNISYEG